MRRHSRSPSSHAAGGLVALLYRDLRGGLVMVAIAASSCAPEAPCLMTPAAFASPSPVSCTPSSLLPSLPLFLLPFPLPLSTCCTSHRMEHSADSLFLVPDGGMSAHARSSHLPPAPHLCQATRTPSPASPQSGAAGPAGADPLPLPAAGGRQGSLRRVGRARYPQWLCDTFSEVTLDTNASFFMNARVYLSLACVCVLPGQ